MLWYALFTFMLPIVSVTWNQEPKTFSYNCSYIHEPNPDTPLNQDLPFGFCPHPKNDDCDFKVGPEEFWSQSATSEFGTVCIE